MGGALPQTEEFDHYSAEQIQDPFPMYAAFRAQCPVAHSDMHGGFYFTTTHDAAKRVFSEFRNFSSQDGTGIPRGPVVLIPLDLDPPEHVRFRRVINPHFTVEDAEKLRPRMEEIVHGLIDEIIERGSADLAQDVVRPALPPTVLPVFGVPLEDVAQYRVWMPAVMKDRVSDPEGTAHAGAAMSAHLRGVVAARRSAEPREDLLQSLIDATVEGRCLDDDEIARVIFLLLVGGLNTTAAAVLVALQYLAEHPEDAARFRNGAVEWPRAVEEIIRFATPVTGIARTVLQETDIEGVTVPKGSRIMAMPGAANRDPKVFEEPDRCIFDRQDNPHLSFGSGAHTCVGRNFARVEVEVLIRTILARIPDYRLPEGFRAEFYTGQGRAMRSLPVTFAPRSRRRP